jgi:hypothetical protein
MMPFYRTCRQVTALVIAREDRALPWRDRLALRLHMAMCAACPNFERQVITMRNAMKQWKNYEADLPLGSDPTEAAGQKKS